jgi:hypothetical protein
MSLRPAWDDPADIRFEARRDRLADEADERERAEAESVGAERMRAAVLHLLDIEYDVGPRSIERARLFDRLIDKIRDL